MKTALVHDWLNGMRGGEKVLELMCDLFPGAPIHTLFYEPDQVSEKIRQHPIIPSVLQNLPFTKKFYRHYLPLYPFAVRRFDLTGYDLVLSISHCAAKGVRVPEHIPHVCYCLSPMRYIWDKYDLYFGDKKRYSPMRTLMSLARRPLQKWDVATAQRVDFFIASSRYIGEKIKKYLGQESTIIPPPIDTEFFCPATGIQKEEKSGYYLVVSALVPYKRVDVAVEAFRGRRERLLIIGKGPEEKRLRKAAPENVTFLGWQRDEELLRWYRNCRAVIFPQEEDFGIVPLEAMACGKPVIAFRGGGALETVTEGKTGVFFDMQTPESLSKALDAFRHEAFDPVELRSAALEYSGERFLAALRKFFKDKVGVTC